MEIITIKELGELTPSKANINVVSKQLAETVKHGNADPIEFAIRLKFIKECLDASMALIQDDLIKAIGNGTTLYGAKLKVAEKGTKYDYSNNEQWIELENQIKPLRDKQKVIEEQMKSASKNGKSFVDEETGEIIRPAIKKSTTSIEITLSK